jgi:hypothetical protein
VRYLHITSMRCLLHSRGGPLPLFIHSLFLSCHSDSIVNLNYPSRKYDPYLSCPRQFVKRKHIRFPTRPVFTCESFFFLIGLNLQAFFISFELIRNFIFQFFSFSSEFHFHLFSFFSSELSYYFLLLILLELTNYNFVHLSFLILNTKFGLTYFSFYFLSRVSYIVI